MNDDSDKPSVETPASGPEEPLAGQRLAAARRAKQVTLVEIAKELHLDEVKVRALENNEFEVLGAPVFAKGHMRKYAQLVGVDIDDVLADYYRLTRSQKPPPLVIERRRPPREFSPGPWIVGILLLGAAAAGYWFLFVKPAGQPSAPVRAVPPAEVPAGQSSPPPDIGVVEPGMPPAGGETATEGAADIAEPAAAPVEPPQEAPAASLPTVTLTLRFSGECWTEVSDATGRRLYFDLGRDGQTVQVSGAAPLTALFGNAGNVSVEVDGEPYAIQGSERRGNTARLTLYGS